MTLPEFALKYKAIVLTAVVMGAAWGLAACFTMPRRENPEYTVRTCVIITAWPGATTEKVEELVTCPIEEAVDALDDVDVVRSTTTAGLSSVFVEVDEDVGPDRIDHVWDRVRAKVQAVAPKLPQGCGEPMVNDEFGDTSVMLLAVCQKPAPGGGPERPYRPREMEIIANRLRDQLKLLPGIARAELHGVRKEVVYLEADMGTWGQIALTTGELQNLLQARNRVAPGGRIDTEYGRFALSPSGEPDTVAELNRLVVGLNEQRLPVHLRDLGIRVRRDYEDPPAVIHRYGDPQTAAPCITIALTRKAGASITTLGETVRTRLRDLREVDKLMPPDVQVAVVSDQPATVDRKINDLVGAMILSLVLVVGVAYLMVGLRTALVTAASIPVVVLISLAAVRLWGVELEQVSLAALIISLGLLVGNAIRVSDQVHRLQNEGRSPYQAVVEGVRQMTVPILMATLTTVAAFLPMLVALRGPVREYVFSLPVIVSLTLLSSWLSATTFGTLVAYRVIRPRKEPHGPVSPVLRLVERLRKPKPGTEVRAKGPTLGDRYLALCAACLKRKFTVLGVAFLLLIGALLLPVGTEFFPSDRRDQLVVDVWLPEGSSLAQTDRVCRRVEDLLRQISPTRGTDGRPLRDRTGNVVHRVQGMLTSVGAGLPRWYPGLNPEPTQSGYAQICVRTTDPRCTNDLVRELRTAAERGLPESGLEPIVGARVIPRRRVLGPPVDAPIGIRLYGPGFADMKTLHQYADRLKALLRKQPGTWDIHDTWGAPGYQLDVDLDADQANLAGVTNAGVTQTLNAFFSGHYLTTYREGDHQVPVYLRLPPQQPGSLEQLKSVHVEGRSGKVPLASIARLEATYQPAKIERRKLHRMIDVRARVEEGLLANVVLDRALPQIRALERELPAGYLLEIGGEQEKCSESQRQMKVSFGISFLLIVLCLVIQYNSFIKPLIILVTLPLAAIGAFLGLWLTGNSLGLMPQLGLLALGGIVVHSATIYLECAEGLIKDRLERKEGLARPHERSCASLSVGAFHDCLVRAGLLRLLPISLTTLTTVGSVVPLAFFGGPLWEGMAFVLIFGLLVATLLTLVVVPALYAICVEDFRLKVFSTAPAVRSTCVARASCP